jgi:Fe(3+) dicitrate transport protein
VVDERRLEVFEHDDVQRVLKQSVPGVYVREEDGFGLRPNIGLRGASSDRSSKVTLMEDGVLFGPAPYSAPAAYYFPMTTRLAGLEVFKGPASIRAGSPRW